MEWEWNKNEYLSYEFNLLLCFTWSFVCELWIWKNVLSVWVCMFIMYRCVHVSLFIFAYTCTQYCISQWTVLRQLMSSSYHKAYLNNKTFIAIMHGCQNRDHCRLFLTLLLTLMVDFILPQQALVPVSSSLGIVAP